MCRHFHLSTHLIHEHTWSRGRLVISLIGCKRVDPVHDAVVWVAMLAFVVCKNPLSSVLLRSTPLGSSGGRIAATAVGAAAAATPAAVVLYPPPPSPLLLLGPLLLLRRAGRLRSGQSSLRCPPSTSCNQIRRARVFLALR